LSAIGRRWSCSTRRVSSPPCWDKTRARSGFAHLARDDPVCPKRVVTSPAARDWLVTPAAAQEKRNAGEFQAVPRSPSRGRGIDRSQTAGGYPPHCDAGGSVRQGAAVSQCYWIFAAGSVRNHSLANPRNYIHGLQDLW